MFKFNFFLSNILFAAVALFNLNIHQSQAIFHGIRRRRARRRRMLKPPHFEGLSKIVLNIFPGMCY